MRRIRDHPRSRGVYHLPFTFYACGLGSSPLARGLPHVTQHAPHVLGIIPARAGFTFRDGLDCVAGRDHPRSRGVYSVRYSSISIRPGSSPLARGLHRAAQPHVRRRRIIPARAGFTATSAATPSPAAGSSPLARGLHCHCEFKCRHQGIIPARAGFTTFGIIRSPCLRDHPRSRGVYSGMSTDEAVSQGSSPLARGLPERVDEAAQGGGIIPARAGFT